MTRCREAFYKPFTPSLSKDRSLFRAAQEDGAATSSARTGSVSFAPSRETKQSPRRPCPYFRQRQDVAAHPLGSDAPSSRKSPRNPAIRQLARLLIGADRKSTRLNSSH